MVDFDDLATMKAQFEQIYRQRYGFAVENKALMVEAVSVEVIGKTAVRSPSLTFLPIASNPSRPLPQCRCIAKGNGTTPPFFCGQT